MDAKQSGRGKKFLNDLKIYTIGNVGSKLITFLLVPFYTYFITDPAEFGYYDMCFTVVFCICPFILLQLNDGSFRFLIETDDRQRQAEVITYSVNRIAVNMILCLCIGGVVFFFDNIRYMWYVIAFAIAQSAYDDMLQTVRGLGRQRLFVSASIFNAFMIAVFSVVTVAVLRMGVAGIFIANIGSRLAVSLIMIWQLHLFRDYYGKGQIDKTIGRQLMRYCLPLLPSVLIWAFLSGNNVFFIKHYLGLQENGIYAVLAKFTGILYVVSQIFLQTWQQNAIEQYNSQDRDKIFSAVFNCYFYLFCGLVIFFPLALRINYGWLVGKEYDASSQYLFLNSLYMMCFAMSMFFDLGYQCAKQTHRSLPGIVIATCVNLAGNYVLIDVLGLYGVILSGIITFLVLVVYRVIDTRKYMKISFDYRNMAGVLLVAIAGMAYSCFGNAIWDLCCIVIFFLIYVAVAPAVFWQNVINRFLPGRG